MIRKEIVRPERLRRLPEGFGWVDHRLVRKGHFKARSREALALYLFLVTVADADGVSYYSEESLCEQLNFTFPELKSSRSELVGAELAAYRKPFFQVLTLPRSGEEKNRFSNVVREALSNGMRTGRKEECVSVGDMITAMTGGTRND